MPIPFEVELIYSYLTEIGLPEEFTLDHIQNSYVGHGLSQKIDILANILLDSIENSVDDPDNHEQEHSDWRSAYDTISAVHFDYIYGRVWEYKTDGELLPQDLSKRFKDVLLVETDLVDMINSTDNEIILKLMQNAEQQTLDYLNAQSMARLFVYCYENPHNWKFF